MANNSPYVTKASTVQSVMLRVLAALIPGIVAYVWFFGPAILIQLALASLTALVAEALVLKLRDKPVWRSLGDGSALVTAWLIALSFPSIGPWWLVVVATLAAILIAKHLYGGLGQNLFNPAMVGFAFMIVAYPLLMSRWPGIGAVSDLTQASSLIFGSHAVDALTMATPLDTLRTATHGAEPRLSVEVLLQSRTELLAGWQWIAAAYLGGGLWLVQQRIITWHMPTAFLVTLAALAGLSSTTNPSAFNGPLFELLSGGAMLAAFFIVTDPVSGCSTPRGKLIFAAGVALITWVIRHFGGYPDGIAFAVLLMNVAAPLIDTLTQPSVFGHKWRKGDSGKTHD
jgi:Na+-translocating ferredoxin:NAD+ oxidoreductase subunit D